MAEIRVESWDAGDRWGYRYSVVTDDGEVLAGESGTYGKSVDEAEVRVLAKARADEVTIPAPDVTVEVFQVDEKATDPFRKPKPVDVAAVAELVEEVG